MILCLGISPDRKQARCFVCGDKYKVVELPVLVDRGYGILLPTCSQKCLEKFMETSNGTFVTAVIGGTGGGAGST